MDTLSHTKESESPSPMTDYTSHPVGPYIDRTMKQIRWNYIQSFKAAGVDITTEQWEILDKLYKQSGLSQTNLANVTFKNTATVSRIIDLLCSKDLIERQRFDNDRRRYKIFLTTKGVAVVEKLSPIVFNLRRQGWNNITEKEYEDFLRIMNRIYDNFATITP